VIHCTEPLQKLIPPPLATNQNKLLLLDKQILKLSQLDLDDLTDEEATRSGAMILFATDDKEYTYFILPAAGGKSITYQELEFTIITPESPIATILIGNRIGTFLELPKIGKGFISELW